MMTGKYSMDKPDLYIIKGKTSIAWYKACRTLVATRLVCSTLVTITTSEPKTIGEFATRVNNLARLSDEDFKLLEDIKDDELYELEQV